MNFWRALTAAAALLIVTAGSAFAQTGGPKPVSYSGELRRLGAGPRVKSGNAVWIFSAPPRGTVAQQRALYQPIVRYLAKVTGHPIRFKAPGNWLTYSQDMTEGKYDLVFDGPHFTSWRDRYLGDVPLVRLPEPFVFEVVVRKSEKLTRISQLAGRPVCANSPPNLGTLSLLSQFSYITRQPYLVVVHGWPASYKGLMAGRCQATVVPVGNLRILEKGTHPVRVLYRSPVYPNQAISAGPRIPADIQVRIREALLSSSGRDITRALRHAYGARQFVAADRAEYAGLSHLLDNMLYFSGDGATPSAQ